MAVFRVLAEKGIAPDFVAGHSLGEYSALVASGALKFSDAVRLVRKRGTYMQEAVPAGVGAMAAIMGLSPAVVADACKRAAEGEICAPANLNSPEQTVISGHAAAVKRAVEIASQLGAKRAVILAVSAPFHSALMMPAQVKLEIDLKQTAFAPLRVPLVTNADADTIETGDEAREGLIRQVTMPVRSVGSALSSGEIVCLPSSEARLACSSSDRTCCNTIERAPRSGARPSSSPGAVARSEPSNCSTSRHHVTHARYASGAAVGRRIVTPVIDIGRYPALRKRSKPRSAPW